MSKFKFPYAIKYKRTANWWSPGGDWYEISTWLNESFGKGNWDYMDEYFLLAEESHANWFMLRWS